MADDQLLSQTDIDSLLKSLSTDGKPGDAPASGSESSFGSGSTKYKIKMHDFKRQTRFAKDQLRTLQHIHENFSRSISTFFSTSLRYLVGMRIASQDQITYEEYIRSVDNPSLLCIFNLGTLEGKAIFEMNLELSFAILDRLLGGIGDSKMSEKRKLTDIEEAVMNKIMQRILQELNEAWSMVVPLEPQFSMFESNPSFTSIVPPNDMVLLITFEVSINNIEGIMNLCIPCFALDPISDKLSASQWYAQRTENVEESMEYIEGSIREMDTDLRVELGESSLTYGELLTLQPGDVIRLWKKPNEELEVFVGKELKFRGLPGVSGKYLAVTITDVVKRGFEDE